MRIHRTHPLSDLAITDAGRSSVGPPVRTAGPETRRSLAGADFTEITAHCHLAGEHLDAVLLRLGLMPDALEQFEKCRRIAPDFYRVVTNAALLYDRSGQPKAADARGLPQAPSRITPR